VIGGARELVKDVYVGGEQYVSEGQHAKGEEISSKFASTMHSLKMP
jgi:hypothetical protein